MNKTFYELTDEKIKELTLFKNNPGNVIEYAYTLLNELTEDRVNVPDPTTPFSYALEMSAMTASTLHQAHETNYRNQYPKLATTYENLYNHMFDQHYIGRFATPGRCRFDIYFKRNELLANLVDTGENGVKRLVLPRGSYITVQDYVFTLLYDIKIEQLAHGGIHVLYDVKREDPLQTLTTNIVPWDYVVIDEDEFIRIRPTLLNVKITTYNDSLMQMTGYTAKYNIEDKYCHFRGYMTKLNEKTPKELVTTHSDIIYDSRVPTTRLKYLEKSIVVTVPSVYYNKGLVNGQAHWEIYTTAGKVDEPLNEYSADSFGAKWGVLENTINDLKYVEPIKFISSPIIQASSMFTGGTDGETFEETRDRVINFANYDKTPITANQLSTTLKLNGYNVIKSRDMITSRTYLATKPLPVNVKDTFTSGASSAMETLLYSINDLVSFPEYVRDNGRRITITPESLFKVDNGVIRLVPKEEVPSVKKLGMDAFINKVNELTYMYTPFFYVLDPTNDTFDLRAYYFDKPDITSQMFIANNETSGYSVSTLDYKIYKFKEEKNGEFKEGFKFRIRTAGTEAYKEVDEDHLFCQLLVKPHREKDYACLTGKYLGAADVGEDPDLKDFNHFWEFELKTDWDVTDENCIIIKDMLMHDTTARKYELPLEGEFYIVHGIKDIVNTNHTPDLVDKFINRQGMDTDAVYGITLEKFDYHLGDHLKNLWSNGLPVQSAYQYERHEEDIPRVYTHDVYDISSDGNFVLNDNQLVVLHRAGDPVMEPDLDPVTGIQRTSPTGDKLFKPVYFAKRGDIKVDKRGNPIVAKTRELTYMIDLFMVDGIYYFSTDEIDSEYKSMISEVVKDNVMNDLNEISKRLLENTRLYLYPQRTMGRSTVIIDEGKEVEIPMRASFKLTYYMPDETYNDLQLRDVIISKTKEIINTSLQEPEVSISDLTKQLQIMGGKDIVAVDLENFKEEGITFTVYTNKDADTRRSVKRIVEAKPDGTIKVVEDIQIIFLKHETIEELKR